MPRVSRRKSYTNLYHIIFRGINKQNIFYDDQDMWKFKKEIERTKEKFNYKIFAYVLMGNHVHLGIEDNSGLISKAMQGLAVSYSIYFNKKYNRVGHLFENRYLSKEINTARYLLTLTRYIHQNPAKSRLCSVENYRWSSYRDYLYGNEIVNCKIVLDLFSKNKMEAIRLFQKFNLEMENSNFNYEILEYEMEKKLDDKQALQCIKEVLKLEDVYVVQRCNKELRDNMISKLEILEGISQRQIARILGLDYKIIQRVWRETSQQVSPVGQNVPPTNVPNGTKEAK